MALTFGSVCSGIEAASVAWKPLGWRASFVSEIEAFPRAVLAHHHPETPLHGDFTTIQAGQYKPIDLLVGGTPCQSFSVAGLRGGLADDRGNLALEYLRLADRLRPRWLVWENVPGVLSSNGGRDFGAILGGMVELGYGVAYRVLDAQHFGVAQRRRRVFVVGYFGDWRRAAAVLFERESLSGHPAPRREAGPSVAALTACGVGTCGADDNQGQAGHLIASTGQTSHCLNAGGMGPQDYETETLVTHSLRGEGFDASEDGTGRGTPLVPICFSSKDHGADALNDLSPTLRAGGHDGSHANAGVPPAIAFSIMPMNSGKDFKGRETDIAQPVMAAGPAGGNQGGDYVVQLAIPIQEVGKRTGVSTTDVRAGLGIGEDGDPMFTMQAGAQHGVGFGSAVRRLTPRECERLQGFPDDYTLIPWRRGMSSDGPRYKALGNSMAVPVMAWIGRRIEAVENIITRSEAA
jgi:DNA (cytosine-5)-methyltransferase 1